MNNQQWNKIKEMDKDKAWEEHDIKYCGEYEEPNHSFLFDSLNVQRSDFDKNYSQSTHPWCSSCYSLYSKVCNEVGSIFEMGTNKKWSKESLKELVDTIADDVDKNRSNSVYKYKILEPRLRAIINCINTRYYHHKKCYKYSGNRRNKDKLEVSNESHMFFISDLCSILLRLYEAYKFTLGLENYERNHHKEELEKNLLLDLNPEIANLCRHRLKKHGTAEEKESCKILFETKSKKPQKLSKGIKPRSKVRSRTKDSYSPKRSKIVNIYKEFKDRNLNKV
jgi:hypothetical protein